MSGSKIEKIPSYISLNGCNNISEDKTSKKKSLNHLKEINIMASNKHVVPEAKEAMEKFKMEAANEVGVTLNKSYNGDITARQAGSVGGQMVKKMIQQAEQNIQNNK